MTKLLSINSVGRLLAGKLEEWGAGCGGSGPAPAPGPPSCTTTSLPTGTAVTCTCAAPACNAPTRALAMVRLRSVPAFTDQATWQVWRAELGLSGSGTTCSVCQARRREVQQFRNISRLCCRAGRVCVLQGRPGCGWTAGTGWRAADSPGTRTAGWHGAARPQASSPPGTVARYCLH